MFEKGEFIIYGSRGVCEITDVSTLRMGSAGSRCTASRAVSKDRDRLYYVLRPVTDRDGKIFTPVDNDKIRMRRILTRKEAEELIREIPQIGNLWVPDEKQREQNYKQAVGSCDCRELVKVIKTLWIRNQERLSQGKKITVMDKKYFRMAEDTLYAELSLSLDIPKEQVRDYIAQQVETNQAQN